MAFDDFGPEATLVVGYSAVDGNRHSAMIVTAEDGATPTVALEEFTDLAKYDILPFAQSNRTWKLAAHPDGGATFLGIDYVNSSDPEVVNGYYLTSTRVSFQGGVFVKAEPQYTLLSKAFDAIAVMKDYVHLSKLNDNAGPSGSGYELRDLRTLEVVRASNHADDFSTLGALKYNPAGTHPSIYAIPYCTIGNSWMLPATFLGQDEWGVLAKVVDGQVEFKRVAGYDQRGTLTFGKRFGRDNVLRHTNSRFMTFKPWGRSFGETVWTYPGHLLDEDGNLIQVDFPVINFTDSNNYTVGINAWSWNSRPDGSVTWLGWQVDKNRAWQSFKFAGSVPVPGTLSGFTQVAATIDVGWPTLVEEQKTTYQDPNYGPQEVYLAHPNTTWPVGDHLLLGWEHNYDQTLVRSYNTDTYAYSEPFKDYHEWWTSGTNIAHVPLAVQYLPPPPPLKGEPTGLKRAFVG